MLSNETKVKKTICIKIDKDEKILLFGDEDVCPLNPGAMLGPGHFGIVLIAEKDGVQGEAVYPTESDISGVCINRGKIKVYENGKNNPWIFDQEGNLIHSITGEKISKNEDATLPVELEYPDIKNPILIDIVDGVFNGKIVSNDESFPVCPGVMLGGSHYGFIVRMKSKNGTIKDVFQPTKNRIDAIGSDESFDSVKVYEVGRAFPYIVDESFSTITLENDATVEEKIKKFRV